MNRRLNGSAAPLPNVCIHESAHAVVAWALGIRVKGIHLFDGGGRTEVVHLFDVPDHLPVWPHFVRELAVCFAGSMASAKARRRGYGIQRREYEARARVADGETINDFVIVDEVADLVGLLDISAVQDEGERLARLLLRRHWDLVLLLAARIKGRSFTPGAEVHALLGKPPPDWRDLLLDPQRARAAAWARDGIAAESHP